MSESIPDYPEFSGQSASRLKVPPHSIEAEQSVLGALMLHNDSWFSVADKVNAKDFYRPSHQMIYEVMVELANKNEPFDALTLSEALRSHGTIDRVGGNVYLAELVESVPGTSNVGYYAEMVREYSTLRQLIGAANKIAESAFLPEGKKASELLNAAEQSVFEIAEGRLQDGGPQSILPLLTSAVDKIERLYRNKDPITGIPTGYTDLDKLTAGLQDSDLIIVAARPSMGKTALALNFAEHAVMNADADDGVVLFFSMEQPAEQLIMRLLSSLGHIDQTRMRTGELGDDDWPRFSSAVSQLKDKKLFIDDTAALTPNDIRTRARRVSREMGGLKMILVDYLQLMRSATAYDNRATEISEISRSLKAIAKEMKCPVVALSQLNRSLENRPDKRPHMSDLRESGAIEQDADVIFFIYRDEVYNEDSQDKGLAEIIIGKQRNGPIGSVKLTFIGNLTKFENYTPSDRYEELMN